MKIILKCALSADVPSTEKKRERDGLQMLTDAWTLICLGHCSPKSKCIQTLIAVKNSPTHFPFSFSMIFLLFISGPLCRRTAFAYVSLLMQCAHTHSTNPNLNVFHTCRHVRPAQLYMNEIYNCYTKSFCQEIQLKFYAFRIVSKNNNCKLNFSCVNLIMQLNNQYS